MCPSSPCVGQAALHEAARECRVKLIPNDVAIDRAENMATRIESQMEAMRKSGALKMFNEAFKARKQDAFRQGVSFMEYWEALAKLHRALVEVLASNSPAEIADARARTLTRVFETE